MYENLDDVLNSKNYNRDSIFKNRLEYKDNIPYSIEKINKESNKNYIVMKCFLGSVSKEEHLDMDSNESKVYKLYKKYIFESPSWENVEILNEDIEDLIFLRMILSKGNEYLEKIDQLLLRIYFESKNEHRKELLGLVFSIRKKYEWAEKYIEAHKSSKLEDKEDKEDYLIFCPENEEYNKYYGCLSQEQEKKTNQFNEKEDDNKTIKNNWIMENYGQIRLV